MRLSTSKMDNVGSDIDNNLDFEVKLFGENQF